MDDQSDRLDEFVGMVLGTEMRPPGASEFVGIIEAKLDHGTRKYGPGAWKRHDMIGELLTELVDTFNYPYLAWRVLLEQKVDESHPQLFRRIEQTLRSIALASFTQWAALTRLLATLDGLGVTRSISGENRVGVIEEDRTVAPRQQESTDDGTEATPGDATSPAPTAEADGRSGGGSGDGEVRREPAHAAAGKGSGNAAPRVRRQPTASE